MKLLLIRHGECLKEDLDPSLSKEGFLQAKALANYLYKIPITQVYVSSLNRTVQMFEEYHKLAKNISFQKTDEIKEIYRVLVGGKRKKGTSFNRKLKDKKRIELFIQKQFKSTEKDKIIVLFTHGNVIKYILAKFLHLNPKKLGQYLSISPASISLIEIHEDETNVKFINDTFYLNKNFLIKKVESYTD